MLLRCSLASVLTGRHDTADQHEHYTSGLQELVGQLKVLARSDACR